jgi:hypothetical protein
MIFDVDRPQLTQKISIFCITQRVTDLTAGTKDRLPADTTNYFCSSVARKKTIIVEVNLFVN